MKSSCRPWFLVGFLMLAPGTAKSGACDRPQDPADQSRTQDLIASLGGLSEDCTVQQFLERPALMELVAKADRAAPWLGLAVESSPSWSVRASAAYVLSVNGFYGDAASGMTKSWSSLLSDPHPMVQLVAARTLSSDQAKELLTEGPVRELFDRFPINPSGEGLNWLPDPYFLARLNRFVELARTMEPYSSPLPAGNDPTRVTLSSMGAAVDTALSQAVSTRRGHQASEAIYHAFLTTPVEDVARHDFLLNLVRVTLFHADGSHEENGICPQAAQYLETRYAIAEKAVWNEQDPFALYLLLALLQDLVLSGYPAAMDLLERVTREHSNEGVRSLAMTFLKDSRELKAAAGRMARLDRERRILPPRRASSHGPESQKNSAEGTPSGLPKPRALADHPSGENRGPARWALLFIAVLLALVGTGVIMTRMRRKKGASSGSS